MLRVKEEEFFLRERRDNHHRRRRYSDDYDSEADLYQQYKEAGLNTSMVDWHYSNTYKPACCQSNVRSESHMMFLTQLWGSDDDDEPAFSPVMRKKAIKVKHVKRREKKFDKKVSYSFEDKVMKYDNILTDNLLYDLERVTSP